MRHGRHVRRVAENGGGQFRTQTGGIQNAAGLRTMRGVRPNSYEWKLARDPRLSDRQRPWPFDLVGFVDLTALPGMIMTAPQFLFGANPAPLDVNQGANLAASIIITPSTGITPLGLRGTIDQIAPFAQDVFGNSAPTTFPSGTAVTWSLLINGRPAAGYGNITNLLDQWGKIAERPIVELGAGDVWQVTAFCGSNAMGLARIGMRVRVRFENQAWLNGERELHNPADLDFMPAKLTGQPALRNRLPALTVPRSALLAMKYGHRD